MSSDSVEDELQKLYDGYNADVTPLLILLEVERERFPIAVLNEIRAVHDHIARIYQSGLEEDERKDEIHSASRHLDRIRLDCYKHLCVGAHDELLRVHENFGHVRLGEVDSGKFLPELTRLHRIGKELFRQAKIVEREGRKERERALEAFREAYFAFDEAVDFLRSQEENLAWSASQQRKWRLVDMLIGFGIGVVASGVVALVAWYLSSP